MKIIIILPIMFLVYFYLLFNIYERHQYVDSELCKAWHIALPGYIEIYYPEQEVDLRSWVGSKYNDLVVINKNDGSENPEATAGLALKAMGLFTDCDLELKEGHYILYKPEKTEKMFSMKAYYRIWYWKKAD